jgi:hypothetical protein
LACGDFRRFLSLFASSPNREKAAGTWELKKERKKEKKESGGERRTPKVLAS